MLTTPYTIYTKYVLTYLVEVHVHILRDIPSGYGIPTYDLLGRYLVSTYLPYT